MGGSEIRRGRRTGSSETRPAVASASRRSSARPARFGQGPSQSRKRRAVRRGRISKATGRKIQIIGKEIQSQGKQIPSFFLPRIGAFQGLTGESILRGNAQGGVSPECHRCCRKGFGWRIFRDGVRRI